MLLCLPSPGVYRLCLALRWLTVNCGRVGRIWQNLQTWVEAVCETLSMEVKKNRRLCLFGAEVQGREVVRVHAVLE